MSSYSSQSGFPRNSISVTPLDDPDTDDPNRGNAIVGERFAQLLWVGAVGDVVVILEDGTSQTMPNVIAGGWHAMPPFKNIQSAGSGTAATEIFVGTIF